MTTTALPELEAVEKFHSACAAIGDAERAAREPSQEAASEVERIKAAIAAAKTEAEALRLADELAKAERLAAVRGIRQGDATAAVNAAIAEAYRGITPALIALDTAIASATGDVFDAVCESLRAAVAPEIRGDMPSMARADGAIENFAGRCSGIVAAGHLRARISDWRRNNSVPGFITPPMEHMRQGIAAAAQVIAGAEDALPAIAADSDRIRRSAAAFAAEIEA
ncbi:MAG TPA: hypothetical protein VLO11_03055 [Luteolibacter sp.]|nr:hypothetical protein [Luteolibacter sp.]